jgi:hypothetical protein
MHLYPGKRRRLRTLACALAVGTLLGAAACAGPPNAADRSYRGVAPPSVTPNGTPGSSSTASPAPPGAFGTPLAGWVDKPRRFAVTLWGSSSCPAVPIRIEAAGSERVSITFEQAGDKVCTADMAPTTHEFTVPAGADTLPLAVALVDGQGGTMHAFVLE